MVESKTRKAAFLCEATRHVGLDGRSGGGEAPGGVAVGCEPSRGRRRDLGPRGAHRPSVAESACWRSRNPRDTFFSLPDPALALRPWIVPGCLRASIRWCRRSAAGSSGSARTCPPDVPRGTFLTCPWAAGTLGSPCLPLAAPRAPPRRPSCLTPQTAHGQGHRRLQPERWRREDDHRDQPRGVARPRRPEGPAGRSRSTGNLTSGTGCRDRVGTATVYDSLTWQGSQDQIPIPVMPTGVAGLDLVPADRHLAGAEIELVTLPERERRLQRALRGFEATTTTCSSTRRRPWGCSH